MEGEPHPVSASVDLAIYRILQEALASTSKTAVMDGPVGVVLRFGEADISLEVTSPSPAPITWSTVAMRERVALCAGNLEVDSDSDSDSDAGATQRLRVQMPGTLEGVLV